MPAQAKRNSAQRAAKSRPAARLGALRSVAFEQAYKGKLAALADQPDAGPTLAEAVKRYGALDDLGRRGRVGSPVLPGLLPSRCSG
jgi:hypothetical protein